MTELRGIVAEDLFELSSVADPRISPDGTKVAFVKTSISKEKNEYVSNIFILELSSRKVSQWTFGESRNTSPRWSPDGSELAFVSTRSGKNQIYVMNVNGGEAKECTKVTNGASNPVWSPDGTKIYFSAAVKKDEPLIKAEEKEDKKELEPLEVVKMKYKSDSSGFFKGHYQQVAVVNLETLETELITNDEVHHSLHAVTPEGNSLLIGADYAEDIDFSFKHDLYLLNLDTKEKQLLTNEKGGFYNASFSPSGRYISIVGSEREFENATLSKIYLYDLQEKTFQCLSSEWNIPVGDFVAADFQQGSVTPSPLWNKEENGFYFTASNLGSVNVFFSDLAGNLKQVTNESAHVYGLTISSEGKAVATISYTTDPSELYEVSLTEGTVNKVTDINGEFLTNIELSKPEPIEFKGANGWTVHGWIMKPVGYQEGEKYPLILEIHGGPHTLYANTYFHEFQTLAANGNVVLFVNPRGSHGYGQEFVDAVRGDYGGNDYNDLMAAVEYAVDNFEYVDSERLGVTGGSYGGFMTNWIVGHTDRFKAAVTQRSISNWISFYGVSDIGYYFNEFQHKLDVNDIEGLWKISPLAYVENIKTPLLILHSEKDYRCPIEQAEQLFIALKHRERDTKFVRFPESNHELSRSGKPNLRIKRLDYINNWFNEYLN